MVPGDGFEPSASWTTTKRSNQLSYPGKGYRYRVGAHERAHVFGLMSIGEGRYGSQEFYGSRALTDILKSRRGFG